MYVRKYPEEADTKVLTDALLVYDSEYRRDIWSKDELKNMPLLHELFLSKDRFRETPSSLKFRVCRNNGCIIFARVGRIFRTPPMEDGALRNEILRWLENYVPEPSRNNFHYLSTEGMREPIESFSSYLEALMKNIPSSKKWDHQSRYMVKAKAKDKNVKRLLLHQISIVWADCDHCGVRRCIYSNNAIVKKDGPSKEEKKKILHWKENVYVCGNKPSAENCLMRILLRCGNQA